MGRGAGATPSASKSASRKRPNAPGQQSIAAAFQAAKRSNTSTIGAGKLNNCTLDSATDVGVVSDQPQHPDVIITQQHGSAAIDHHLDKPLVQVAAADDMQQQQQQQEEASAMCAAAAASAEPAVQKSQQQQKQQKQQTQRTSKSRKPVADTAAAATRKPRPQSGAAATKTSSRPAAAAAAAAAGPKDSDSAAESLGSDNEVAAGDGDAVAAGEASFTDEEIAKISGSLLAWYDRVQRILPWRRNPYYNPDTAAAAAGATSAAAAAAAAGAGSSSSKQKKPTAKQLAAAAAAEAALAAAKPAPAELSPQEFAYYVWVSEIMLQQTQVSRVVTYFNKWIAAWPTVTALAAATQEEVNEVWAGLGYYRRAKYLLDGAQFIVNKLDGKFPETAAQLRQIPGIGPYTAAAVASIAFNDHAAAVDGNVIRVCARLRAVKGNPTKLMKVWDKLAAQILHPDRPGCHNQAMMELGATVCKPVNPSCDTCPASSCCTAYKLAAAAAAGDLEDAPKVTDYPEKVAKAAKAEQQVAVCVLKVLLLPDATTPVAVAAAAAAAAPSSGSSKKSAAGGAAAGGVKSSIRSFFKPTSKQQQDAGSAAAAAAAGDDISVLTQQQQQLQLCESDLLAAGATAYYLLVQRPENGLLAGLWEFPGTVIDTDPTPTARRSAVDTYMSGTLNVRFSTSSSSSSKRAKGAAAAAHSTTAAAGVHVVHRRQLGSVVHIFSHIRQTLHAEELVVLAPSLDAVCTAAAAAEDPDANTSQVATDDKAALSDDDRLIEAADEAEQRTGKKRARSVRASTATAAAASGNVPGVRWVAASDMVQAGLTSGVRKVFNLSLK